MKGKKMMQLKKLVTICIAASMLTLSFAGCGGNENEKDSQVSDVESSQEGSTVVDTSTEENGPDLSEQVELVFYLYGDAPADMKKVEDKINEILLEKINATISFRHTTYTDALSKYKMVLSSGEDCDLIYTANWLEYANLAAKQAFYPLDELLDTCMPEVKALFTEEVWNAMRIDGTIYSVPDAGRTTYGGRLHVWREDLRKKYDLPVPDTFENLEAYLEGVKANEPEQTLIARNTSTSTTSTFKTFDGVTLKTFYSPYQKGYYSLDVDYSNPSELFDYWHSDLFKEDMEAMKRWADKGFWSKNILSHKPEGDISNGGEVITNCNYAQYLTFRETVEKEHPDWELAYVVREELTGVATPQHPTTDGTAIAFNSKNPERAAMALQLFMTDAELERLLLYGIKGEHYTVDANGYYVDGPQNANYPYEGSSAWSLKNAEIDLIKESSQEMYDLHAELGEIAKASGYPMVDILSGFREDSSAYSAERAALVSVLVEYLTPLQAGMVEDVDAAIEEFLEAAETAGLSMIQDSYKEQWADYCEQYGY